MNIRRRAVEECGRRKWRTQPLAVIQPLLTKSTLILNSLPLTHLPRTSPNLLHNLVLGCTTFYHLNTSIFCYLLSAFLSTLLSFGFPAAFYHLYSTHLICETVTLFLIGLCCRNLLVPWDNVRYLLLHGYFFLYSEPGSQVTIDNKYYYKNHIHTSLSTCTA